jgi:SnoaL-like polyketide cyclase
MCQRDNPECASPATSYSRKEVLLAAPAVVAVGMGIANPAAAPAVPAKPENECLARESIVKQNVKTFHHLDFQVFNHQQWDKLHLSHSDDVVVHWPDGRTTVGIDAHIEDLKGLFVWAPDTQVFEHTILFGGGDVAEFTGCVGIFGGTFTQPMPIGGGNTIPPTGKPFKINFSTTAHWTQEGVLNEEYLLWDNQELSRQLGLS